MKLIAFDQSTTKTGYCVMGYETGEIIEYGLIKPKGETNDRIRQTIRRCMYLCTKHEVTFVYIEGIQVQRNPVVFEVLAKLQGTLEICLEEKGYFVNVIKASEWRRRSGIKSRKRKEIKEEIIKKVKDLYDIDATEDECEAIMFAMAFKKE